MLNRSAVNEALRAKPDCLTPEELEKLAEASSPNHPHLAGCPRCQAELALLKSFEASEPLPDEGAAVAWISARLERQLNTIKSPGASPVQGASSPASWLARWFGGRSARWLVPAVAMLVIAVTTVALLHRPQEPDLRADAGNGPAVYRSREVEVSGPSGEVAEAPRTLNWKAVSGAADYRVSITEVDDAPLWTGHSGDSLVTIPDATRAKMLPGKPVLWRVTALDGQGRVLATSQVQRFSVRRYASGSASGVLP